MFYAIIPIARRRRDNTLRNCDTVQSNMTAQSAAFRLVVLVDTATAWGRGILSGIQAIALARTGWQLLIRSSGQGERQRLSEGAAIDAVIARVGDAAQVRHLRQVQQRCAIPVVNVSGLPIPGAKFPRVTSDLTVTGQCAAGHLLASGCSTFAFVGPVAMPPASNLRQAFSTALSTHGAVTSISLPSGREHHDQLCDRLGRLPRPLGILTWSTPYALDVLYACRHLGLSVPEQVAILSGDYDPLLASSAVPALSSIVHDAEGIGRTAAIMVGSMAAGAAVSDLVQLPPCRVESCLSTDRLASGDPLVAQFVQRLRHHADKPGALAVVLGELNRSRRSLERHLQTHLGHGPAVELRRIRLERACHLLRTTDLTIREISRRCGYTSQEYFAHACRQATGQRPQDLRQQ
jgi:LacI family transcriptional regulator